MDSKVNESPYRWWILLLGTLTNVLVVAAPSMCMSVLFDEISRDLNLNLVQVGLIWGITALPGIVTVLLGGMISDRFGPRRVILVGCLWVGITGALRGLSVNFATLAATMMLVGVFTGFMTMNSLKACGIWFPRRQLGLASGVLSMGMALGFLIGSLFSATILSPWLGNWRNVLYFYGAISVLMTIPWYFSRSAPGKQGAHIITSPISFRQTIGDVARIRNVWLYGLAIFGIGGCIQGALGYLPLYLRGMGWQPVSADGALSAFHMVSMLFCIPIALWSDRLGTRKKVLVGAALMVAAGVGLLSVVQGPGVWIAVSMAGLVRDGFMAVFMTAILETEGVGAKFAGTATGIVMVFSGVGNLLAPPLGNSLAAIAPGLPFVFWSALTGLGLVGLLLTQEKRSPVALAVEA